LSSHKENIAKRYYREHIAEAMEHVVALKIIARIFSQPKNKGLHMLFSYSLYMKF